MKQLVPPRRTVARTVRSNILRHRLSQLIKLAPEKKVGSWVDRKSRALIVIMGPHGVQSGKNERGPVAYGRRLRSSQ